MEKIIAENNKKLGRLNVGDDEKFTELIVEDEEMDLPEIQSEQKWPIETETTEFKVDVDIKDNISIKDNLRGNPSEKLDQTQISLLSSKIDQKREEL